MRVGDLLEEESCLHEDLLSKPNILLWVISLLMIRFEKSKPCCSLSSPSPSPHVMEHSVCSGDVLASHRGFRQVPLHAWTRVQKTPSSLQIPEVPGSPDGGRCGRMGPTRPLLGSSLHHAAPGQAPTSVLPPPSGVGDREKQTRAPLASPLLVLSPGPPCTCQLRSGGGTCKAGKGMCAGCREQRVDRETLRLVALGSRAPPGEGGGEVLALFLPPCLHSTWSCPGDLRPSEACEGSRATTLHRLIRSQGPL